MAMRRQTAKFAWILSLATLAMTAAGSADSPADSGISGTQLALFGFGKPSEPKAPRPAPKQPF